MHEIDSSRPLPASLARLLILTCLFCSIASLGTIYILLFRPAEGNWKRLETHLFQATQTVKESTQQTINKALEKDWDQTWESVKTTTEQALADPIVPETAKPQPAAKKTDELENIIENSGNIEQDDIGAMIQQGDTP